MAGVIATTPKDSGRGDSSRAKPGDFRKHLNFCEFVKHEENVGRRGEKSVKNLEKRLKFAQITVLLRKNWHLPGCSQDLKIPPVE
jgi:hypothetical protein